MNTLCENPSVYFSKYTTYLATKMAQGSLKEFYPTKESIEDFKERFEFYCLANNVKGEGEHARRKKAFVRARDIWKVEGPNKSHASG